MKLKQRILSLALAGAMLCSLCPPALAAGEGDAATQTQVTAGADTSEDALPADGDSELPASTADDTADPGEGPGPAANGGLTGENTAPAADPAVAAVQDQLDALPTAEELAALSLDAQRAVYDQVQAAYDAYTALTADQQAQLTGAEVINDLFDVFNGMMALAADSGFNWQIENSSGQVTNSGTSDPVSQNNLTTNTLVITGGTGSNISTTGIGGTLELRGGIINASGNISSAQYATITSGTIKVTGEITALQTITISGGNITANSISIDTYGDSFTLALNITGGIVDVGSIKIQNNGTTNANSTFTVNGNNAVVFADDVTVTAGGFASKNYQNGVVFEGTSGKVYGSVTLPDDVTIPEGYTLTIPSGASLTVPAGSTLTNKGTITVESGGTFTNSGTIENYGMINGTVGGTTPQTPATVSVTVTPATTTYGSTVTLTANVTSATDGTVTFYRGTASENSSIGTGTITSTSNGQATATVQLDGEGWNPTSSPYTITAVYSGGSGLLSGSGTATLTVSKATPAAPVGPIATESIETTSVTLLVDDPSTSPYGDIQYGYTTGEETTPGHWQTGTKFSNLQPGTDYIFYARYAGNDFYNSSPVSENSLTVTTQPEITTTSLETGYVGVYYEAKLSANVDSVKNVTWSIPSGSLPTGLQLSGDTISGTPTATGTFDFIVQASIGGGLYGNLPRDSMVTLTITINAGTPDITATTYNGESQTNTFTYGDTITVSGTIAASATAPSASNGISLLAEPAQNQVGLYVSGNDNPIATAGVDSNGNFTLSYDTAGKGIIPGETAQTLTVKYGGSGTLNTGSTDVTITLNPKPVTATVTNIITKVYDGGTTATVTLGFDEGAILTGDTVTVSAPNAVYASAGVGDNIAINFGTLTVEGSDANWYSVSAPTGITGSITAAASSVDTAPAAVSDLTYNGSAQNLVTAGTATGGNLMYALGTDADTAPTDTYSSTIPQGIDAGTYYVWYKVQGDDNHNDTDPVCVTVTIAKAAVTVTANSYTKTYGESDPTFAYTVSESTPLMGSDSLTGLTLTRAAGEDAGEYAITLTEAENANPNYAVTTVNGTLTVKARDIADATVTLGDALIDNGQAQTQTINSVTVKLDNGKTEAVTYTVTGNTVTGAGAHTMTLTGTGNYTGTSTCSFVVLPAPEDMTFNEEGTCTVENGGTLAVHVYIDDGLPETTITTSYGELLASLVQNRQITTEDLAALANPSAHLRVVLQVKGKVSQDDQAKIQAALGDYTLGQYLDLTLQKVLTVNDTTVKTVSITEPGIPLDICVTLPQSLINTDGGVARTYRVLRLHNGQVDALDARYADGKLTFATDRFSLYAIAYRDEAIPAQGGAAPAATATPAPAGPATAYYTCPACGYHNWTATAEGYRCDTCGHIVTAQLSGYGNVKGLYDPAAARASASGAGVTAPVPQTGDESKPALWAVVCALSAAALLGLGVAKRKRQ